MTGVVGRVHLEKDYPVYDIGDPAFSFYVFDEGQVALADEHGPVRTLRGTPLRPLRIRNARMTPQIVELNIKTTCRHIQSHSR